MGLCETCMFLLYIDVSDTYFCFLLGKHKDVKVCTFYRPRTEVIETYKDIIAKMLPGGGSGKEEESKS